MSGLALDHRHRVQQIMAQDDDQTHGDQGRTRQMHQGRQGDHRQADGPDDLQIDDLGREREGPGEIDQGQLQRHQEQAPFQQEAGRGRRSALARLVPVQPGPQAGQGHEDWGAQMGRQPGEEQGGRRRLHIHRVRDLGVDEEELPRMIDQHQQDDQTAQGVDRTDAFSDSDPAPDLGGWNGGGSGHCSS